MFEQCSGAEERRSGGESSNPPLLCSSAPLLSLRGVSKTFGKFHALDDVDFHVNAGEIVGLLGENGAGKSTLLGLVSGNLAPTNGTLAWQNEPLILKSPRDASALGIGIVHQHFQLVPAFSVAENLALAAPNSRFKFSRRDWEKRIAGWARELDWQIDPRKKIDELGIGERQRIEILKALFAPRGDDGDANQTAKLLLLDEPTANLTPGEVDELFGVLRRLKARGCGVVFVSHKLNEVLALCDRITVLRRGKNVGERDVASTGAGELAQLMVGRALAEIQNEAEPQIPETKETVLEIENLSCGLLRDFSLQIRRGEIVGIAGVDGNGQAELLEVLSGLRWPLFGGFRAGHSYGGDYDFDNGIWINGKFIRHRIRRLNRPLAIERALIPADRKTAGLIGSFALFENMALHPAFRAQCKKRFGFDWNLARTLTRELMEKFDVRAPHEKENSRASQLSGGNQQKLIIARALSFPHSVVIAADPTRGLDVAATRFVHEQLKNAARAGAGVLLVSSDLDEILALSHRIGVLYAGRLLPGENLLPRGAAREEIGKLMGGFSQTKAESR